MDRKKLVAILAGVMAAIMVLSLLLGLFASTAHAASSDVILGQIEELKQEQDRIDKELAALEEKLAANNGQIKDMISRKDGIDQQIALLMSQIENVSSQVSAYNLMIADKQAELEKAEKELEALNKKYKERIRAMEEQGTLNYLAVILNASSFVDLLDRMNMMVEIANSDQKRLEALKEAAVEVNEAREALAEEKKAVEVMKADLEIAETTLNSKRFEADKLLQELVAKGDEFEDEIFKSELLQDQLMNDLAQAEDDYDEAKYQEWLATSVPPTTTSPAGPGNQVGSNVWYTPTKNFTITSVFGMRYHPIYHKDMPHNGIDMAAVTGTPVYATRTGVVTTAAYQEGGAGWYVKINHGKDASGDSYSSIYMHMTHFIVKRGQYVTAGQIIGYVGSTGGSTGPHLHFGIAKNGKYVDPLKYIKIK